MIIEHWTLSRVVGRDGRPRTGWHLGAPDEWPEHSAIEAIEVVPAEQLAGAVDLIRALGSAWRANDDEAISNALVALEDWAGLREQGGQ